MAIDWLGAAIPIIGGALGQLAGSGEAQAERRLRERQLALAENAYNQASNYFANAATANTDLMRYGQTDRDFYDRNLPRYLAGYEYTTGVGGGMGAVANPNQYLNAQQRQNLRQAQTGATVRERRPNGPGLASTPGNLAARQLNEANTLRDYGLGPGAPTLGSSQGQQQGEPGATTSPYQLTPAQQTQLNQQLSLIRNQEQSVLDTIRERLSARGISPNVAAAVEAQVRQQYGAQAEQVAAQFAETARQQREQALQYLLGYIQQQGAFGTNTYGQGVQNMANLGAASLGAAGQAQSGANAAGNMALSQQQRADQFGADLAQYLGYVLGGGFNRPQGTPPIVPGGNPTANVGGTPFQLTDALSGMYGVGVPPGYNPYSFGGYNAGF
jgi:hypothetical protein